MQKTHKQTMSHGLRYGYGKGTAWLWYKTLQAFNFNTELLLYLDTVPSIIWLPEYLKKNDDFDCGEIYVAIKPT